MLGLQGYGPSILEGATLTLEAALLSLVLATVLGLAGALAKLSPLPPLRWLATAYTTLIRGVPDLLLMLIVFFGGQVGVNQLAAAMGYDGYIDIDPFIAGVATLAVRLRRLHDRDFSRRHPGRTSRSARGRACLRDDARCRSSNASCFPR